MSVIGSYSVTLGTAAFQPVDPVAIGLNRLPIQFAKQPIIVGILTAVLTQFVQLEQSIARTSVQRNANVANGASLTNLGKLVGLPRITTIDDDFRRYVRAQIAANNSLTTFENILKVAVAVLGPTYVGLVVLHNEGTATARLRLTDVASDTVGSILATLAQAATAVGVRLVIEYSPLAPSTVFTLDTGPGLDVGHLATAIG